MMVKIRIRKWGDDGVVTEDVQYSEGSCIKIHRGFNEFRTVEGKFEEKDGKMKFIPNFGDRGLESEIRLHGREFNVEMDDGVVVGICNPVTNELMEIWECEESYGHDDTIVGVGTGSSGESKYPESRLGATGGKRKGGGRKKKKPKKQAKKKTKGKKKKIKRTTSMSLSDLDNKTLSEIFESKSNRERIKKELKKRGIEYGKSASLLSTQSPIDIVINDFNGNVDEYINSLVKPEIKSDMDLVLEALEDSDGDSYSDRDDDIYYRGGKRRQRKKRTKKKSRRKKRKTVRKKKKRRKKK